jgi:hypothetical protein
VVAEVRHQQEKFVAACAEQGWRMLPVYPGGEEATIVIII